MKHEEPVELASLRFEGERFLGQTLDVDAAQEIVAYRAMVRECAMALWGKRRGISAIVIPGFKDRFYLRFNRVDAETTTIRLERLRAVAESEVHYPVEERDVFEEAAEIIDATMGSLNRVEPFPRELPAIVLPFLGHFGETLRGGERLFVRARTSVEEVYVDLSARALLAERYSYFVRGSLECARQQGVVSMLEQLAAMGEAAPPGTWDNVPTDLSMR